MKYYSLDRPIGPEKNRRRSRVELPEWRYTRSGVPMSFPLIRSVEQIRASRFGRFELRRRKFLPVPNFLPLRDGYYSFSPVRYVPTGLVGAYAYDDESFWNSLYTLPRGHISGSLDLYGTRLMASAWPTNPTAELATFLGELRDGLPAMVGASIVKRGPKGSADEFLNLQFGVMPLISDGTSFYEAWTKGPEKMERLRRNAGKPVKRRRAIPTEVLETTSEKKNLWPIGVTVSSTNINSSPFVTSSVVTRDIWFTGSFYYHLPNRADSSAFMDAWNNLRYNWGAIPELSTGWELVPFSFVADYFANVGPVIKNLDRLSQGNHFADAFVMSHVKEVITRTHYGAAMTEIRESKRRERVNPYGLAAGTKLNAMQATVLGALGASRLFK